MPFDQQLSRLGFNGYAAYLASDHWQNFRAKWWRRYPNACCYSCENAPGRDLHHQTYQRLGHERLADVVALCRLCHKLHHIRVRAKARDLEIERAAERKDRTPVLPAPEPAPTQWREPDLANALSAYLTALRCLTDRKALEKKRNCLVEIAQAMDREIVIPPLKFDLSERRPGQPGPLDKFSHRAIEALERAPKKTRRKRRAAKRGSARRPRAQPL